MHSNEHSSLLTLCGAMLVLEADGFFRVPSTECRLELPQLVLVRNYCTKGIGTWPEERINELNSPKYRTSQLGSHELDHQHRRAKYTFTRATRSISYVPQPIALWRDLLDVHNAAQTNNCASMQSDCFDLIMLCRWSRIY
jgi:hypothetical protein